MNKVEEFTHTFQYDGLSQQVWMDNYKAFDDVSREELWMRAATSCSAPEDASVRDEVQKQFYSILEGDRFVPGGRILANLGSRSRKQTTLYNCFVHNPHDIKLTDCDSISGIFHMLTAQAKTLQSEGGYGINASWIRPSGSYIEGIGSRTPGPIKFMELWDKSSEIITSGSTKIRGERKKDEKAKIRKGAQMCVLNVWHPDIMEFIVAKQTPGVLTKFNVSVGITEGFMKAVKNNGTWDLKFPDTTCPEYKNEWFGFIEDWEEKGLPVIVYETVNAVDIWNLILTSTYNRAEPGVLFLDIANKLNPLYYDDKIATTNPCGEIPQSTGVCNIGSINLVTMVIERNGILEFDEEMFKHVIKYGIRFLDNVNDISTTPLPEYTKSVKDKRRIGLGVMGLGSLHMMLGIPYGSEESIKLQTRIAKIKAETELLTSAKLGQEKGSFGLFDPEKYFNSYYFNNITISDDVKKELVSIGAMRNSHQSMNAPTGNTGIYAKNVSGGIEPVFSSEGYYRWCIVPEFRRRALIESGLKFPEVNKSEWFETEIFKFTTRGNEQILKGSYEGINYEIDKSRGLVQEYFIEDYGIKFAKHYYGEEFNAMKKRGVFASVSELTTKNHTDSLKVWAHYTNMAISKTVNIPNDYSFDEFKSVYMDAWDNNIKGITTYREGTMTAVLETKQNKAEPKKSLDAITDSHAPKRPEKLECEVSNVKIGGEQWTIFVGLLHGRPYEVFGGLSKHIQLPKKIKSGIIHRRGKEDDRGIYDFISGEGDDEIKVKDIVKAFENPNYAFHTLAVSGMLRHGMPVQFVINIFNKSDENIDMYSFYRVVSRVLKHHIKDGTKAKGKCPNCGSEDLIIQEGCSVCTQCLTSKCS